MTSLIMHKLIGDSTGGPEGAQAPLLFKKKSWGIVIFWIGIVNASIFQAILKP